jgi:hypothetical protein
VSAVPGVVPWTNEIFEQVSPGVIFYAVGAQIGGGAQNCSSAPGVMATFTFIKIGVCNECDLCLTSVNPNYTRLTTDKGVEVTCAELGCSKPIFDEGVISSNCPGNIDVNSDCKMTTADVSWDPIAFVDECDGTLNHTCTCVHEPLGGPAIDCLSLADHGGIFPQGSFTFKCDATGATCTDPVAQHCEWTVNVSDQQTLDVVIQLSPVIDPFSVKNPDGDFTRCICFEMFSSCSPIVMTEECKNIEFGGPFQFPGKAETSEKIDKGKFVCITARDRQHSLRSSDFLTCAGGHWIAEFKGDPFFGGNWLIQGNLNRDHVIDILDFGTFLGQFNQRPNPGPDKLCEDDTTGTGRHADFNGDGVVTVEDYTFIQINFLEDDKDVCCPEPSAGAAPGRTEVSVKDLREMGLGDLAIADLNNDGIVNTDDMASFVQGVRPKTDKAGRGSVGRPSTIRGSR